LRDPDRFINDESPGAQEWWYFDAISDDQRDALVLVWYASLPFDPAYGVATLRHLRRPNRHPAPHPRDHCAVGISWYREGRTMAYALNAFRRDAFHHRSESFEIEVAGNRLHRDAQGYHLRLTTPAVDGRHRISADLRFRPAENSSPYERDLGTADEPHLWMLAAADCRVEGELQVDGPTPLGTSFVGRGYHDHNAGAVEMSLAMKRWRWGRVHLGPLTHVYYLAEPRQGASQSLWITCDQGAPREVIERPAFHLSAWTRNRFGIRSERDLSLGERLDRRHQALVDDGPFYQRWLSRFTVRGEATTALGITELLEAGNLHRPWFNWMIPYRLKRPGAGPGTDPLSPVKQVSRLSG
jgi:carotenoid 1,2-hydratase